MISKNKKYENRERRKKEMATSTEKPNKNRIFCPDCAKPKMLFESEAKALNFIKWNGGKLETEGKPLRAYYCPSCCGWHISHQEYREDYKERTDSLLSAYNHSLKNGKKKIDYLIHGDSLAGNAKKIFLCLSEEVQKAPYKEILKKHLKRYFRENNIEDPHGQIRAEVYRIWRQENNML